jgi:hypothetical protein
MEDKHFNLRFDIQYYILFHQDLCLNIFSFNLQFFLLEFNHKL